MTKRLFDLCAAALLLLLLAIPLLALAWTVRRRLGSPVLFRQVRPGLRGRPFEMLKFRTMTDARDSSGQLLPDAQRLTPFGQWLRSTSLDELPELWNVLQGQMSLVGPRPVIQAELDAYYGAAALHYMSVRPGITGLWQVSGRSDTSYAQRVALDMAYVSGLSVWQDIRILLRTPVAVLSRRGAH